MRRLPWLLALVFALVGTLPTQAQTLDLTFRFVPDLTPPAVTPVRAFLPGSFNDWGPNSSGRIQISAPSAMDYVPQENEYRKTLTLDIGGTYQYKVHYHNNGDGSNFTWITDPLNPVFVGPNADSQIEVVDPMFLQAARETDNGGNIVAVSAGLFGTAEFTRIDFEVNATTYTNGLDFYDAESGIFRFELPEAVAPGSRFALNAEDMMGRTVSFDIGVPPPTVVDQARPVGIQDGITYSDAEPGKVFLSLLAPSKSYVYVLGDFNDFQPDDAYLMRRDVVSDDEVYWWLEMDLTPGETYAFQYLVDGTQRVTDAYVPLVLDPNNDRFIPESVYPNLPEYPDGAQGIVGVLTPGATPYDWQDDDYERPAQQDLVIYEMLVRDFITAHDYDTLADTLDYFVNLGVNALELMPIQEFGGNENWGYQPTFHLAVDKYYGPPEQLKAFIDAAHQRGLAIILDVVYNHADQPSPLVTLFGANDANPYVHVPEQHPFNVFTDLDHTYFGVQRWLDRANEWWLTEYRVDGFRFDLSKGFTTRDYGGDVGAWSAFNQGRIDLLTRMADEIWAVDDDAYIILEHFADAREDRALANYGRDAGLPGMMLWNNLNRAYSQSAMGYPTATDFESTLERTYPPNNGYPLDGQITFMESHDEQWLMYRNREFGNRSGDYDTRTVETALERMKLVGAFFYTVPGPRMLWQFAEIGYGGGPGECLRDGGGGGCATSDPGRTGNKPIRWDYFADVAPDRNGFNGQVQVTSASEREARVRLYKTWGALLKLRNENAIFTSELTDVDLRVGRTADRYIRLSYGGAPAGQPSEVVIVGNFGVVSDDVTVDFAEGGDWFSYFDNGDLELASAGPQTFTLLPGEFRVYTNEFVEKPEAGLVVTDAEQIDTAVPATLALDAAYPNPFATSTTLEYALPQATDVTLTVYDLLGRQVATLVDAPQTPGRYAVSFDAAGLASGAYVVRLAAGDSVETTRLTITR
ncbi:MAG: alpha-amylase family glycosyl hydrolase [Bacteroidota bacterium]